MKLNAARADGASLCFRCAYSVLSIFGRVQPRVPQIAKENPDSQNSISKFEFESPIEPGKARWGLDLDLKLSVQYRCSHLS